MSKQSLLIIRERDVGFFSLFLQTLNTLLCVRNEELACSVYVDFGKLQAYFTGSNTWERFFPTIDGPCATSRQLNMVDKSFKAKIAYMGHWNRLGAVFQAGEDVYWTGSYYPVFSEQSEEHHISHKIRPSQVQRKAAAAMIEQHLQPHQAIRDAADEFARSSLKDAYVIGVQFRGTDARKDPRRIIPSYTDYEEVIEAQLSALDDDKRVTAVMLVASDEQAFIEHMRTICARVVCVDTIRHDEGDGTYKMKGPRRYLMPAFIAKDKEEAIRGALLDYMALCHADVLIHNLGSLTHAVLLTNSNITSILVGELYE